MTDFIIICISILRVFKSSKLYFYIIRYLKLYENLLDSTQLNSIKEVIHFIHNNCFDFDIFNKNIKNVLSFVLFKYLFYNKKNNSN